MPTVVVQLLDALRDYLISLEIVRDPRVDNPDLPPIWLEPRNGVPAPGEGKNAIERGRDAVVAVFKEAGIPPRPYEGFIRQEAVSIWIRATKPIIAFPIEAAIRDAINDKRGWIMEGLVVNESLMFRDLQRIAYDQQGYTGNVEYLFHLWRED